MGHVAVERSERTDQTGTGLDTHTLRASNTGRCVEDPLIEGEVAYNLGAGKIRWPGWRTVDSDTKADVTCDLRRLTLPDASADRLVAIHVLEHLYPWETKPMLLEWKRVLKVGGQLVLELPNMQAVLNHIFLRMKKGQAPSPGFSWLPIWGDPKYQRPEMMHKWGYFPSDVLALVADCGFGSVELVPARYHFPDRDMRIEARKETA